MSCALEPLVEGNRGINLLPSAVPGRARNAPPHRSGRLGLCPSSLFPIAGDRHARRPALGLLAVLSPAAPGPGADRPPAAASRCPPLRFLDMQGNEAGLDAFAGKVVVLNLWATWCAPCREEMPSLDRLRPGVEPSRPWCWRCRSTAPGRSASSFLDEIGVAAPARLPRPHGRGGPGPQGAGPAGDAAHRPQGKRSAACSASPPGTGTRRSAAVRSLLGSRQQGRPDPPGERPA